MPSAFSSTGRESQGPGRSIPAAGPAALKALWDRGLRGRELLKEFTGTVDSFIQAVFAGTAGEKGGEGVALVALGGYGRQELFPFSDIDVMLLYAPEAESRVPDISRAVFYPLWDSGLEVGHSVRTVRDCLEDARGDFFFQVALLDSRFLCGDQALFDSLRREFTADLAGGRRTAFAEEMAAQRRERHRRFGDHAYLLKPNIKESRGGLRDVQAVIWTAAVLFGLDGTGALEEAGLLTPEERAAFEHAWEMLIRIRNRLHFFSGRKNDQLYFEYQEEIARALDYRDGEGMLGVEHFMRDVHGYLKTVAVMSDLFFEHVDEVLQLTTSAEPDRAVEIGIDVLRGRLHIAEPALLQKRPELMMRVFAHSAKTGLPVHHMTRRMISRNLGLVTEKTRRSKRMSRAFLDVLAGDPPLEALEAMLDTGLLTAYVPEFARVRSLSQHDVYHVHTVDRHLLQTVEELCRLRASEARLFMNLDSPHLLFLAALFHDIGKGQGSSHARRGARIVLDIGSRLGLTAEENACLSFLVEQHLFLVDTAMRRDLEDEAFILKCARKIQDPERLDMLYLLSIADSKATGPNVWSDWKAALVQEFYLKIAHLLEQPELIDPDRIEAAQWMRGRMEARLGPGGKEALSVLPEDYILSFTPDEVARHIELKEQLGEQPALVSPEDRGPFWSVFVVARDHIGLLSKICGVLSLYNLNVLSAQIFTLTDGTAMDVLDVTPSVAREYSEQNWKGLQRDLRLVLEDKLDLAPLLAGKYRPAGASGAGACGKREARVLIDNETSDFYSVIEVYAEDRPALLYDITRTLADFGINIFRAKIATRVDQIVDVFYVLNKVGERIEEPAFQEELRGALLHAAACGVS